MNTAVSLPILAATPTTAPAMPATDPIFAAIAKHRRAMEALIVANAEQQRILALTDEMVGPCGIRVLDIREPSNPPGWHPYVDATCWVDVEKYVPKQMDPELHAHYLSRLQERSDARSKFVEETAGDIDALVNVPGEAEYDAAEDLTATVPTTVAGLLAAIAYVREAKSFDAGVSATFDEANLPTLVESLGTAAKMLMAKGAAS